MGRAGSPLVPRVRALLGPAPRQRPELLLVVATLALLAVGSAAHAQEDTESVFEHAMVGTHAVPPSLHVVAAGARHHR
jgi:hypothetical protein